MQGYNCIVIYNEKKDQLLLCERISEPYKGLLNFVGGKIEAEENSFQAAYRELEEETGISKEQIELTHMMDFTYYNQGCYVEVYVGYLAQVPSLKEEKHPLKWIDSSENFFDMERFAGEGNMGHILEQVKQFGAGVKEKKNCFGPQKNKI